jgi:hypothetical protein
MATRKQGLIKADENDRKAVQELLQMRKEHEGKNEGADQKFQEALQEEFHQVWDDTIKPALEQLKETTEELLKRFSDFEDDFRGYLREKQPDVDVDLLEEIYGDALKAKARKKDKNTKDTEARPLT